MNFASSFGEKALNFMLSHTILSVNGIWISNLEPEFIIHYSSNQSPTKICTTPIKLQSPLTTKHKACFANIIPSLYLTAAEHLGIPQSATQSLLATAKRYALLHEHITLYHCQLLPLNSCCSHPCYPPRLCCST